MKNQSIPPIHREHFEQWLDRQPDDRVWDYWCPDCVFGTFMREFYGVEVATLSEEFGLNDGRDDGSCDWPPLRRPLPEWFMPFAEKMNHTLFKDRGLVTMPALRAFFNLPKEQPSPFTLVPQPS